MAEPVKTNKEKFQEAGGELARGAAAMADKFKSILIGGKDSAKAGLGGIAGFVKGIGDTAVSIVTGTGKVAGKTMGRFPILAGAAVAIGATVAVKKWMDGREKSQELEAARNANELMETRLANDALAGQMKSMPQFNNPEARADFVKKYAEQRAASQQQATAR